VTTAGIYGTITEIDDDFGIVTLEIAPNTEIRLARAAVATRLMDDEEFDEEDEVEGAEPGS
jgi:preprotein translocase subunit YajC